MANLKKWRYELENFSGNYFDGAESEYDVHFCRFCPEEGLKVGGGGTKGPCILCIRISRAISKTEVEPSSTSTLLLISATALPLCGGAIIPWPRSCFVRFEDV